MDLKGIILDVDGTIADTEELHRLAFNKAFKEFKLDWHWSEENYRDILSISGGKERFKRCLDNDPELKRSLKDVPAFIRSLHQCKSAHYRELLESGGIALRPGIKRIIDDALSANIKLGIATSSSTANFNTLIQQTLGVDPETLFSSIVTSDIVHDKKPCPAAYQCALAGMALDPEQCIAIEDTANGNQAAQHAGMQVVITTHAYTLDNDFSGAALVVDHLGEIDQPYTVSQGESLGKQMVDVELLQYFVNRLSKDAELESFQEQPAQYASNKG